MESSPPLDKSAHIASAGWLPKLPIGFRIVQSQQLVRRLTWLAPRDFQPLKSAKALFAGGPLRDVLKDKEGYAECRL